MEWNSKSIGVRWFNDACYKIRLPNGKVILVDPYIDSSPLKKLGSDALTQVDYVFISHTHFDHVLDLDRVMSKFNPQVYVGCLGAVELAKQFDICGGQMNLCYPGETYMLDGATLTCLRGKHTSLGDLDKPSHWKANIEQENLPAEHEKMNMIGSYEYTNYLLMLPGNLKFLIWGGGATLDAIAQIGKLTPNISIIQLPREPVEKVAQLYAAAGGQVIFPHHHDSFLSKGPEGKAVIDATVEKTKQLAPDTSVVLPEKGEWYEFSTSLKLCK